MLKSLYEAASYAAVASPVGMYPAGPGLACRPRPLPLGRPAGSSRSVASGSRLWSSSPAAS
eukprot:1356949-Heterocapsa_arctica.AAC.1